MLTFLRSIISQLCSEVTAIIENGIYKRSDGRTFNNTSNLYKHINNYSNYATDNYMINKISNVKKTHYNFNCDTTLNKTSNDYSTGTYNVTKNANLFNITDNS